MRLTLSLRATLAALLLVVMGACTVQQAAPQAPAPEPEVVPATRGDGVKSEQPADEQPADEQPAGDPAQPAAGALADGEACKSGQECASGICEGEGCDVGVCAPARRACTKDLRPYCGCDGQTFSTSGSCPGQLYAYRGECRATE